MTARSKLSFSAIATSMSEVFRQWLQLVAQKWCKRWVMSFLDAAQGSKYWYQSITLADFGAVVAVAAFGIVCQSARTCCREKQLNIELLYTITRRVSIFSAYTGPAAWPRLYRGTERRPRHTTIIRDIDFGATARSVQELAYLCHDVVLPVEDHLPTTDQVGVRVRAMWVCSNVHS